MLIIAIIVVIGILAIVITIRFNKAKLQFEDRVSTAVHKILNGVDALNRFGCINNRFTLEQENIYKKMFQDDYDEVNKLLTHRLINKTKEDITLLKSFKDGYESVSKIRKNNNAILDAKQFIEDSIDAAHYHMEVFLSEDRYLTESAKISFINSNKTLYENISQNCKKVYPYLSDDQKEKCKSLVTTYSNIEAVKENHNRIYTEREKTLCSKYFDSSLNYPLSLQQRDAIVTDEDNCLVISAAGSGKTSTMEGKVRYLVEKRSVDPTKILMVTYTKKAAISLTQRLDISGLECITFHKFALKVIGSATGMKPTIFNELSVREQVYNQLLKDETFLASVNRYLLDYLHPFLGEFDYEKNTSKYVAENKKRDRKSALPDIDGNYVFADSDEERKLCDILSKNGIKYRHEEPYEHMVADTIHRQYKPDFSIYYNINGQSHRIYLEHFGIDIHGNVSKRWGDGTESDWQIQNDKYHEGMKWKRNMHIIKGTTLIETTSADFKRGNVEEVLLNQLRQHGVPINTLSQEELYKLLIQNSKKKANAILTLISTFVTLMKARCISIPEVMKNISRSDNNYSRDLDIVNNIITPYYNNYTKTLNQKGEIDFTDAILMATNYCNEGYHPRYDYILIDEFQDISIDKYKFLQSLRTVEPLTKLFCVCDDWQSIYRFSGSDMALFKNFPQYFGFTAECKLEGTYRFCEPLIGKSSRFIQKNPQQMQKTIFNTLPGKTDIEFVSYESEIDYTLQLSQILDNIPTNKTIYLLGRYGFEIKSLKSSQFKVTGNDSWQMVTYNGRTMDYLTVHKAKGLESDYVIILGCNSGIYGFPSTIADDPVLRYVLSEWDEYEYGEERRLFYVAITRSKEKTFVLYKKTTPSIFIDEFM